jgi:RNA polymerase sigma factor (sigma-70 family)
MDNKLLDDLPTAEWDKLIGSILKRFSKLCRQDALLNMEDLQQEAWLALLDATQQYNPRNPQGAKFSTFAYQHIRFHLCRYVTAKLHNKPYQTDADPVTLLKETAYSDTTAEDRDLVDIMFQSIEGEPHVDILREHYIKGKSCRQIAKEQGISHETASSRVKKLLELMSKRLNSNNA